MTPDDIGLLVDVSDPRVAPDGSAVAFVVTTVDTQANTYRSRIWMAPASEGWAPLPFSRGEERDRLPRWSPDGRRLAFVSHRDGSGSEVYVLPAAAGGELLRLATSPEEVEELAWSRDGRQLAFLARDRDEAVYGADRDRDRPARKVAGFSVRLDNVGWTLDRRRHAFVVPTDGTAEASRVTQGPFEHAGLAWAPDGRLVVASGRHDGWDLDRKVDLWLVDPNEPDRPAVRLTSTDAAYGKPSFSSDGGLLAFTWSDPARYPGHSQVGVGSRAADSLHDVRLLTTSLDRQCDPFIPGAREPLWDGDGVLFLCEDHGNTHLWRAPAAGGSPKLVVGGERHVAAFDHAGGVLAFSVSTATEPADLYVAHGEAETRVTDFSSAFTRHVDVASYERFTAVAPDGAEIDAWIVRPPGLDEGERRPALLNIHGGPFTQYGNRFFDEFQIQASAGYVVIAANPRGSSGAGEDWARAICGPASFSPGTGWGGADAADLLAVVDEAVRRYPEVDAARLGVLGGSYGGFMASWLVGHTTRFRAACSERAVNNHLSFAGTSDIGAWFPACYFGPTHLDDPGEYLRQSPITYVRDITTPLLILHSDSDLRCPVEQAEQLYVALRLLGRDVEFVRFPGEGHEMSRSGAPRHRIERAHLILDWFDRHLR